MRVRLHPLRTDSRPAEQQHTVTVSQPGRLKSSRGEFISLMKLRNPPRTVSSYLHMLSVVKNNLALTGCFSVVLVLMKDDRRVVGFFVPNGILICVFTAVVLLLGIVKCHSTYSSQLQAHFVWSAGSRTLSELFLGGKYAMIRGNVGAGGLFTAHCHPPPFQKLGMRRVENGTSLA